MKPDFSARTELSQIVAFYANFCRKNTKVYGYYIDKRNAKTYSFCY